jgi:hypothetical protein
MMLEPGRLLPPLQRLPRTQALRNAASSVRGVALPNQTVAALQLDERETVRSGCSTVLIALHLSTVNGQTTTLARRREGRLYSARLNKAIG